MTTTNAQSWWQHNVPTALAEKDWCFTHVRDRIDLAAWQAFTRNVPRDPYVERRWKRMSWLALDEQGRMKPLGECPMAQGGQYNDADSMADKLRWYPALEQDFLDRPDVRAFVEAWAGLWGLDANEPILMQITGVRGSGELDPLQGQGIHADGCRYLSIMVLDRDNVSGAESVLYTDRAGQEQVADQVMEPGDVLHLRDDRLFHGAKPLRQEDINQPYERFIIIINASFVDGFQNRMLRRYFPEAVIHEHIA